MYIQTFENSLIYFIYKYMSVYIHIYVYIYINIHINIYIYIHTDFSVFLPDCPSRLLQSVSTS